MGSTSKVKKSTRRSKRSKKSKKPTESTDVKKPADIEEPAEVEEADDPPEAMELVQVEDPPAEPERSTAITKTLSSSPYQLDSAQVLKASVALLKHINSKPPKSAKPNLLEDAENPSAQEIWLNLTAKKMATASKRLKPARILLPHPVRDLATTSICLIVKDPQRTYKDLIAGIPFLSGRVIRVISVSKLRRKFNTFELCRQLASSYDIFLADDRIVRMLPNILGKAFLSRKRPVPLCAAPEKLESEVNKCLQSTFFFLHGAASSAVRVGLSSFGPEMLAANIKAVVEVVVDGGKGIGKSGIPGGWKGLRSVHLKGASTASLPIWLTSELYGPGDVLKDGEKERLALERVIEKEARKLSKVRRRQRLSFFKSQRKEEWEKAKAIEQGTKAEDGPAV